ncbi:hypothetical protein ASZ90_002805 [hydrocarbon metagenome]|uniref:Uncharacterized protein n=1 Tax=hydrocarbon metagenome TaxID=938273 RepID=A0A0W8G2G3_9ZZZZ
MFSGKKSMVRRYLQNPAPGFRGHGREEPPGRRVGRIAG